MTKITKRIFAPLHATLSTPPQPMNAAINATTRNKIARRNMVRSFQVWSRSRLTFARRANRTVSIAGSAPPGAVSAVDELLQAGRRQLDFPGQANPGEGTDDPVADVDLPPVQAVPGRGRESVVV